MCSMTSAPSLTAFLISGTPDTSQPDEQSIGLRKAAIERIRNVHARLQGNVSLTARQLGVSRNTVYRALR